MEKNERENAIHVDRVRLTFFNKDKSEKGEGYGYLVRHTQVNSRRMKVDYQPYGSSTNEIFDSVTAETIFGQLYFWNRSMFNRSRELGGIYFEGTWLPFPKKGLSKW